ncbi:MAG TPA: nucleotide-binding protein [Polyangiaceae bacterium]|nr:nucleotide-binding protein [Polyangiaceae bacterium]
MQRDERSLKPVLFIGSSSEALPVARAIRQNLANDASVKLWDEAGDARLTESTLSSLLRVLDSADFAAFVMAPDDKVISRGKSKPATRDNVLFELGMFVGRLGPERTFLVHDRSAAPRIPSDLKGIQVASYESRGESLRQAVGVASDRIREAIERVGISDNKVIDQVKQLARAVKEISESASTRGVGTFPAYMKHISGVVSEARRELLVASDFASYGSFSSHVDYERYKLALRERAHAGLSVRALHLDTASQKRLLNAQFGSWSTCIRQPEFQRRVNELADRMGGRLIKDRDALIQCAIDVEETEHRHWNFATERRAVACFMPTYVWIADDSLALFTTPVFHDAPEQAFVTRDPTLIHALRSIWRGYELFRVDPVQGNDRKRNAAARGKSSIPSARQPSRS